MRETLSLYYKKIKDAPESIVELFIFLFSFAWLFLLSYRFPFMYDDVAYLIEAAKGFSFPEGFIYIPRFFFIYVYKVIFFFVGFQPLYYHLCKVLFGALLVYFYYKLCSNLLGRSIALITTFAFLTSSLFVFTTIWIAEPVTLALLFRTMIIFLLLFYPENWKKYLLIGILLPAALFSKEPNIIILLLLCYYFFTKNKGVWKAVAFAPLFCVFLYTIFIPTRSHGGFAFSNLPYFFSSLSRYYTLFFVLLVFGYIFFYVLNHVRTKKLFVYDVNFFIILWFLLGFSILLLPVNQEERYLMEILSPFFILLAQAFLWIGQYPFLEKWKKSVLALFFICFFFALTINAYGIIKTEIGWGSFFRGVATVADTVDEQYPGSLLVYQSGTGDFFTEFHHFSILQRTEGLNMTTLAQLQDSGNYSAILYVQYPPAISIFEAPPLDMFVPAFTVQEGIYEFTVYEFKE